MAEIVEAGKSFFVMNTQVNALVCVLPGRINDAYRALGELESLFRVSESALTRFDPASELSRLNASAGKQFAVSELLFEAVAAAVEASRQTGGLIDPTVLPQLQAAGYDRSFNRIGLFSQPASNLGGRRFNWTDIRLDSASRSVFLPRGCGLDLGGVGKGWTVDLARCVLKEFDSYVVDAGGDIIVEGTQGNGRPWTVGVADPFDDEHDVAQLGMTGGAVCTSSTLKRRWGNEHNSAHHIIDPRTGAPSNSGIASATVTAPSALQAEIVAKAAIILGPEKGLEFAATQAGLEAVLVTNERTVLSTHGLKERQYVA